MTSRLALRARRHATSVLRRRIYCAAAFTWLAGCQTTQLPPPADVDSQRPAYVATSPTLANPTAPSDPGYTARPGHKAEATAALLVPLENERVTTDTTEVLRSQVFNQASPVTAALAALEACEQRRATHTQATAPCELRRRGATVIHNTSELLDGLTQTRPAFLWRIKNNDITVYLAGSIHVLKPTLRAPPSYYDAFSQATQLVLEVDRSTISPPELQALVRDLGLLPKGTTLFDLYTPDEIQRIESYLGTLGMSLDTVQQLKPAMLLLQSGVMEYTSMGYLAEHGVDNVFEGLRGDRELRGLETMQEQLHAATALPLELQAELLLETIDDAPAATRQISELVRAWLTGDTNQLHQQFLNDTDSEAARRWLDDLLAKRNINMARRIATYLNSTTTTGGSQHRTLFALVGAAHLVGPGSVIELLQGLGFKTQQMQYASLELAQ